MASQTSQKHSSCAAWILSSPHLPPRVETAVCHAQGALSLKRNGPLCHFHPRGARLAAEPWQGAVKMLGWGPVKTWGARGEETTLDRPGLVRKSHRAWETGDDPSLIDECLWDANGSQMDRALGAKVLACGNRCRVFSLAGVLSTQEERLRACREATRSSETGLLYSWVRLCVCSGHSGSPAFWTSP